MSCHRLDIVFVFISQSSIHMPCHLVRHALNLLRGVASEIMFEISNSDSIQFRDNAFDFLQEIRLKLTFQQYSLDNCDSIYCNQNNFNSN